MFSSSTKYAIRAIVYLAQNGKGRKYTTSELAAELGIPNPYLGKVLQLLARNEIISSTKGPGGGFFVDEQNMHKRLIDVIDCTEGPQFFKKCVLGLDACSEDNPCFLHQEYVKIKGLLDRPLYQKNFSDIIAHTGS